MGLRRVATPEGSRYFGLPIGAPIAASLKQRLETVKGRMPDGALATNPRTLTSTDLETLPVGTVLIGHALPEHSTWDGFTFQKRRNGWVATTSLHGRQNGKVDTEKVLDVFANFDVMEPSRSRAELKDHITSLGWVELDKSRLQSSIPSVSTSDIAARFNELRAQMGVKQRKGPPKVVQGWSKGNCRVLTQQRLTTEQAATLLDHLDAVLKHLPSRYRDEHVDLLIPNGDRMFASGVTGGYVTWGIPRIMLSPALAKGRNWLDAKYHPPAWEVSRSQEGVIAHELGHVLDGWGSDTRRNIGTSHPPSQKYSEVKFWQDTFAGVDGWKYAKKNVAEGYADAYMQWVLGGPGSSPVSDAYAQRYGWDWEEPHAA